MDLFTLGRPRNVEGFPGRQSPHSPAVDVFDSLLAKVFPAAINEVASS
jgi:hypothetical protein